jgi:hypothetical protein
LAETSIPTHFLQKLFALPLFFISDDQRLHIISSALGPVPVAVCFNPILLFYWRVLAAHDLSGLDA